MADLVTLDEVKAYLSITSPNQDDMLNLLISKTSDLIKIYCGTTFIDYYNSIKEEIHNGGDSSIILEEFPVRDILLMSYSADYGQTYTDLTVGVDYYHDKRNDCITSISGEFTNSPNGYKVNYRAGYEVPPEPIKLACLDLIKYYKNTDNSVKSTRNAGSNTTQIEFITSARFPSSIRIILDQYRVIL